MRILSVIAMVATLTSCNQKIIKEQFDEGITLTAQHFKDTATINDDEFEDIAVITTQEGFKLKHGLLRIVWSDEFLRGFINKKNNTKIYQVYVNLKHQSGGWLFPYKASFGRPLITVDAERISSDVDCSGSEYGGCTYYETVVFEVPEKEFRRVQYEATPTDIKTKGWAFKIKTKSGKDYKEAMFLSEIIGFMEIMDEYVPIPTR